MDFGIILSRLAQRVVARLVNVFPAWIAVVAMSALASNWAYAGLGEGIAAYDRGDYEKALMEFSRAAEQGNAAAQFNLGLMYATGQGVPKDEQQAVHWYRKAAEQGDASAQLNLGVHHAKGQGVPKDELQAVYWYRKAAEQGKASAQLNLGLMYAKGEGVPKDDQQAYFWWLIAASTGNSEAIRYRDLVEKVLMAQQRADAQRAARDWKPKVSAPATPFAAGRAAVGSNSSDLTPGAPTSTGSGFVVARQRVVTNHHVTADCRRLRVGGRTQARLLTSDPRNDLALIEPETTAAEAATVRVGKVKVGESATVAGFPLSGLLSGFNVTTGNISGLAGMRGDTRLLQISAPVQAGNSGGPLLDASGNVVGVVVSKLNAMKVAQVTGDVPQNVNFAINVNVLASFLDANGVDYKTGTAGPAMSTPAIARRAQAFTVLIECWQ